MNLPDNTISVLLPVHAGVDAGHLESALASLLDQSLPAEEIIVVEDGPLPAGHLAVLDRFEEMSGSRMVRVRLAMNKGAGAANGAGLNAASGAWIAKADADDISVPDRFKRQRRALDRTGADVCGGSMWEFDEDPEHPSRLRTVPLGHDAIARRMRVNNPINHPTAMYRRRAAVDAGGYPPWRLMQDYDLFARMFAAGAVMMNLEEPLVLFRAGDAMRRRRSARGFARREWTLQCALHRYGVIGRARMVSNFVIRMTFRSLPAPLLKLAYTKVLSSPMTVNPTPERDA